MKSYINLTIICVTSLLLLGCGTTGKSDPYKDMSAEQIYSKAKAHAQDNRFVLAIKDYEALESHYPYGEYTNQGQLGLIHAYHKRSESPTALAVADRFIRINPKHSDVDYAYYMKGVINFDENYSAIYQYFPINRNLRDPSLARQAFDDFNTLIEKFPKSKYSPDARQRMIQLKNQLASHELHVAEHYFNKGAYLAAANRAGYVVNQFDQTETVPKALATMVKAYRKLGMSELAKDSLHLLQTNFPNSKEINYLS